MLRHRAETESRQLGKDEPHPVAALASSRQFIDHLLVDAFLRSDKALQLVHGLPQKRYFSMSHCPTNSGSVF
jgi:hypothetical protein